MKIPLYAVMQFLVAAGVNEEEEEKRKVRDKDVWLTTA
jgi:hypothetical protein